jgi:hypothetical protein
MHATYSANFMIQIYIETQFKYINIVTCFSDYDAGLDLVNRFIGSSLVVTTISSYTVKVTVTIAHVASHTKSSNSSSSRTAVPLELRNSSQVNSHSRILSYRLRTDHAQKTHFYCCVRVSRGVYRSVTGQCVDIPHYDFW